MLFRLDRCRCNRRRDVPTSDVIHANRTHPDFRYSRPSPPTLRASDDEEHKENHRPLPSDMDGDVIRPHFRCTAVDRNRNRKWSAMKRTSTARSSLQSCAARLVPEVSDIRPDVDEAGTQFSDDSSVYDIDDIFSVTENQPSMMYLRNSK